MPYRKLFLSRWAALIWAAGILWTAADVADWAKPDAAADDPPALTAHDASAASAPGEDSGRRTQP